MTTNTWQSMSQRLLPSRYLAHPTQGVAQMLLVLVLLLLLQRCEETPHTLFSVHVDLVSAALAPGYRHSLTCHITTPCCLMLPHAAAGGSPRCCLGVIPGAIQTPIR